MCIIFVYCFGSFAQYVDMYVDNYVDNVSILLYVLLYYYINTKICSASPDPKQNICSTFGNLGKNRAFSIGGSKNSNKCSVFPAAYKLLHPQTDFILKYLNKNPIKPSKIKHFTHFNPKTPISHPISSNPTKINTFTHFTIQISTHNPNHFLPI